MPAALAVQRVNIVPSRHSYHCRILPHAPPALAATQFPPQGQHQAPKEKRARNNWDRDRHRQKTQCYKINYLIAFEEIMAEESGEEIMAEESGSRTHPGRARRPTRI